MTGVVLPFTLRESRLPRVELSSPGTQRGLPFYVVDIVESDGGRACMWDGTDLMEARRAARDCTEGGLPFDDRTGDVP